MKKYNNGLEGHDAIIQFSSFKEGKDQGIDLYYRFKREEDSENDEYGTLVVQVKHSKNDYSKLYSSLKKRIGNYSEVDKVSRLNPDKYIFVTSVSLSLHNKESLKSLFNPYILSIDDIYGRDDLNRLLVTYPNIEKRYVPLYFSNPLTLDRIIKSSIYVRSNYTIKSINNSIDKYVQTDSFEKAVRIIEDKEY